MEIGDGNNENFVRLLPVNDAVREPPGQISPRPFRTGRPRLGKAGNSVQRVDYFSQKLVAQSRRFMVVIFNRFVQFDLCDVEKSNFHYLYLDSTCSSETALSFPFS